MHLHEDLVRFEKKYIGEHRFQPIVTDFSRSSQPVVRYMMNDILLESKEPCPCGSTMIRIEKIEGRMDEVLLFKNKVGKEVSIYPDFLRRCIVIADERIENYQLVQVGESRIEVYLDCEDNAYSEAQFTVEEALRELFTIYGIEGLSIVFSNSLPPRNPIEKMRRIIRKV